MNVRFHKRQGISRTRDYWPPKNILPCGLTIWTWGQSLSYVPRNMCKTKYDLQHYSACNLTEMFLYALGHCRLVLGWNCNIKTLTSRPFWNQIRENKWLVPTDDSYSCIIEPDVSDKVHKSVGYQDANLKTSVSAIMWTGTAPSFRLFCSTSLNL